MSTTPLQHNSTSGRSPAPEDSPLPSIPESNGGQEQPRRRGSFSFLRRTKSGTQLAKRTVSGGKLTKKQKVTAREQAMTPEHIPQLPPMIPPIPQPTHLQTFSGEIARPDSMTIVSGRNRENHDGSASGYPQINGSAMYSNVPIPPIPRDLPAGGYVDPYARTESMTNRGRYSYASSAISTINSPRRMRRKRDPSPFK